MCTMSPMGPPRCSASAAQVKGRGANHRLEPLDWQKFDWRAMQFKCFELTVDPSWHMQRLRLNCIRGGADTVDGDFLCDWVHRLMQALHAGCSPPPLSPTCGLSLLFRPGESPRFGATPRCGGRIWKHVCSVPPVPPCTHGHFGVRPRATIAPVQISQASCVRRVMRGGAACRALWRPHSARQAMRMARRCFLMAGQHSRATRPWPWYSTDLQDSPVILWFDGAPVYSG